jgi:hypothetical protein
MSPEIYTLAVTMHAGGSYLKEVFVGARKASIGVSGNRQ